jgi:DEAD/DEAH box helicase domain-containing protein
MIRAARLNDKMKPIAVFLDGYTYHHDRIGQDMAQRMAIVQSGRFHAWSLTWHDVENKFKAQKAFFDNHMEPVGLPSGNNFNKLLEGYGLDKFKKHHSYNSFDLLIHFLENPDEAKWQKFMFVFSLLHLDPEKFASNEAVSEWMDAVGTLLPEDMAEKVKEASCPGLNKSCLYGSYESVTPNGKPAFRQYVVVEQGALTPHGEPLGVRVGCLFNDGKEAKTQPGFQQGWNGFLRLYNYYQFLPYSYFVTSFGIEANAYNGIKLFDDMASEAGVTDKEAAEDNWDELKELTDVKFHRLLGLLRENNWPLPEAGYELEGVDGEIIASAELGWESLKIAFLTNDEIEYKDQFAVRGWKTIPMVEILNEPEKYMNLGDSSGGSN